MEIRPRINLVLGMMILLCLGCQDGHQSVKPMTKDLYREILATELEYSPQTGEIKYTLPQDAFIRIRIGLKEGGPLLRTLIDWEYRKKGPHVEVWDGQDEFQKVGFGQNENFMVILNCMAKGLTATNPTTGAKEFLRKSPRFTISLPESSSEKLNGISVVQGPVSIRVSLDPKDDEWLRRTKFEVSFFLDQTFLFEDEEGSNPYTFLLNTSGINEGEHVLTINVIGYDGEIGTQSIKIYLKKV